MFETHFQGIFDKISTKNDLQFNKLINRLDKIIRLLDKQIHKENSLMATIQNVVDAVTAQSTVDDSIVVLLNGIVQQLKDAQASGDPAALDAVVSSIQSNTKKISDAVTANTPVA
jgi:ABC-type transporter Mla subunit MlaD